MIKEGPPKLLNYLRDGVDCSRGLHRNYTSLADAKVCPVRFVAVVYITTSSKHILLSVIHVIWTKKLNY